MLDKEIRRNTKTFSLFVVFAVILLVAMIYSLGTPSLTTAPINLSSTSSPTPQTPQTSQSSATASPNQLPTENSATQPPSQTTNPTPNPDQGTTVQEMKSFSTVAELFNYINSSATGSYYSYAGGPLDAQFLAVTSNNMPTPTATPAPAPTSAAMSASTYYSTTNIQVAGVDEADIVKTDGQYIYTVSTVQPTGSYYINGLSFQTKHSVYILNADLQNAKVVAKINLGNDTQPAGLFLSQDGNKLAVLASRYQTVVISPMSFAMLPAYSANVYTYIYVYDVSNKAQPVLTRNFTVSGSYFNSRMIGNYAYVVVSQPAITNGNAVTLPTVSSNNNSSNIPPTSIYYSNMIRPTYYTYTSFFGVNIMDDSQQPTSMTVLMGGASTMYVSQNNIYVTYPLWTSNSQYTSIYRISINGLTLTSQAQGSVPGYVINQYAMDENTGYLRIVTNWYNTTQTQTNNVYVINPDLKVVGKLEGLAKGENLHSVRFMGDKCFIVTFIKTDPLFVIDLTKPENPVVLGELQISGYSDYLHPFDNTHLIGVGKETADSASGTFAWYQGLKLALFDVTNVNDPNQLSKYLIGDRGTDSLALTEPKSFLFDKTKGLLVIPVNLAIVDNSTGQATVSSYGQMVWQGAYVFNISIDGGFTLKGRVTNIDQSLFNPSGVLSNSTAYYNNQNSWITRTLYIENTLYTISNKEVKLSSLTDLTQITQIPLS